MDNGLKNTFGKIWKTVGFSASLEGFLCLFIFLRCLRSLYMLIMLLQSIQTVVRAINAISVAFLVKILICKKAFVHLLQLLLSMLENIFFLCFN